MTDPVWEGGIMSTVLKRLKPLNLHLQIDNHLRKIRNK
jgi:hypothetical protein